MYDAKQQRFKRRITSLIIKCHELWKLCDVDVALIISRNGRYYTYRSLDLDAWPPPMDKINISYPKPIVLLPRQAESLRTARRQQRHGPEPAEEGTDEENEPLIGKD